MGLEDCANEVFHFSEREGRDTSVKEGDVVCARSKSFPVHKGTNFSYAKYSIVLYMQCIPVSYYTKRLVCSAMHMMS